MDFQNNIYKTSEQLYKELKDLNHKVILAIEARKIWIKNNIVYYSKFKIGDYIYDLETKEIVGTVTDIYYYNYNNFDFNDDTIKIHYKYKEINPPYKDNNTHTQFYKCFGTHEDILKIEKIKSNCCAISKKCECNL